MELYYLMSITDRERAEDMAALYRDALQKPEQSAAGEGQKPRRRPNHYRHRKPKAPQA